MLPGASRRPSCRAQMARAAPCASPANRCRMGPRRCTAPAASALPPGRRRSPSRSTSASRRWRPSTTASPRPGSTTDQTSAPPTPPRAAALPVAGCRGRWAAPSRRTPRPWTPPVISPRCCTLWDAAACRRASGASRSCPRPPRPVPGPASAMGRWTSSCSTPPEPSCAASRASRCPRSTSRRRVSSASACRARCPPSRAASGFPAERRRRRWDSPTRRRAPPRGMSPRSSQCAPGRSRTCSGAARRRARQWRGHPAGSSRCKRTTRRWPRPRRRPPWRWAPRPSWGRSRTCSRSPEASELPTPSCTRAAASSSRTPWRHPRCRARPLSRPATRPPSPSAWIRRGAPRGPRPSSRSAPRPPLVRWSSAPRSGP
mmetsp:Transcript_11661/g.34557  ORF Transcript_11661/g.34557 Transcript_11661/m.34557 type:complete len:373 (-) Transcript_11661:1386-2504(-)